MYSGAGKTSGVSLTSPLKENSQGVSSSILENVFHLPIALGTIRSPKILHILQVLLTNEQRPPLSILMKLDILIISLAWLWYCLPPSPFYHQRLSWFSVIRSVLGELFDGIIISDRFSAYIKYHKDRSCGLLQLCWAHIIRDVKALSAELAFGSSKPFSPLMRQHIGAVFRIWHAHKRNTMSREQLIASTQPILREMRTFL